MTLRANEQLPVGDRRRGYADRVHRVGREQFVLAAGLNCENITIFTGQEDLAARGHGLCRVRPALTRDHAQPVDLLYSNTPSDSRDDAFCMPRLDGSIAAAQVTSGSTKR